jgi:ribose transport system substrate-binding protein
MKKSIKVAAGIVAAASLFALAGCSNGGGGSNTNAITDPAAIAAGEAILPIQQAVDTFTAPGASIANVASLKGKTVYYIPATMQVPLFKIVEQGLQASFGAVGIKVVTCDAKTNPQDLATCLGQAVDAKAAAVIDGSMPYEVAPNAFDAVTKAGIPIVMGLLGDSANQGDPAVLSDLSKVGYVTPNFVQIEAFNAMSVINQSNAKANVLVVEATDTQATQAWIEYGALPTYKDMCPNCKVTVLKTTTSEIDKLPSLISAKLVADPTIDYIQSDFDSFAQAILQGVQSASSKAKVVSMDAYLDSLQGMKSGGPLTADTGYNLFAAGWYMTDQALRMMTGGKAVEKEVFPFRRMFTPANVGTLDLTAKGQESGSWYGKADYMGGFSKLWGLAG